MYPATWREVNTMTIAFGHGIAVSPLHLAMAVAATVNGGILHPPTLIRREPGAAVPGTRVLSAATSQQMRQLLRLVVADGTGRNADAPGYFVGGKTGTAEKQVNGRYKRKALISSFVAAFPIHAPRYVVVALLDEPKGIKASYGYATGGWTAAPVISRVIQRAGPLLGIAPVDATAPDVINALAGPGIAALEQRRRRVASN
jgi:cell division protein FtsI (penicillin-binding protein 3)